MIGSTRFVRLALGCSALLMVSGCVSSPPTHYIALNSTIASGGTIDVGGPPIQLGHIEIPIALDRPYLVRRTGPNTRKVSDTARWIAPLDGQIHELLANDLVNRLGTEQFVGGASDSTETRVLTVSINRFSANMDNVVLLAADWRVMSGDSAVSSPSGHVEITVRAESGQGGAVAAAMSRALDLFAMRIVTALKTKTDA